MLASWSAAAHEFWLLPETFVLSEGNPTTLTLHVGEGFTGAPVSFSSALIATFRHHTIDHTVDLQPVENFKTPVAEAAWSATRAGGHLLALDTYPEHTVLAAEAFHAYLQADGLGHVIRAREAAGSASKPGRERFRRNVKTLIQVGNVYDDTYAKRTGQRLEIMPLSDPARHPAGQDMGFQVLFDGRGLGEALVRFWHKRAGQLTIVETFTDSGGKVTFTPPWPGVWMASSVHMVPVTDSSRADWESYWGNLTFALPSTQRQVRPVE
jgi:uncharacterized GH25 family protein